MRTIETKVYQIEEHPNKEKCFQWIRDNLHDLNQHSVSEIADSLKALQTKIGGNLNWSISQVPDRGEFITFTDYDHEELCRISPDDCPLTGVCWDIDVIRGLREGNIERVLDSLHSETEHIYSDNGLLELCIANELEFTENGEIY